MFQIVFGGWDSEYFGTMSQNSLKFKTTFKMVHYYYLVLSLYECLNSRKRKQALKKNKIKKMRAIITLQIQMSQILMNYQ